MKKVTVIAIVAALILWGLLRSPQSSEFISQGVKEIKSLKILNLKNEKTELPEQLSQNMKKLDDLIVELDVIKADYEERLFEYRKLDSEFTSLVMKNRKNPNPELVKQKEAELEDKFVGLSQQLKNYQEKSQELYKFQSSTISNI